MAFVKIYSPSDALNNFKTPVDIFKIVTPQDTLAQRLTSRAIRTPKIKTQTVSIENKVLYEEHWQSGWGDYPYAWYSIPPMTFSFKVQEAGFLWIFYQGLIGYTIKSPGIHAQPNLGIFVDEVLQGFKHVVPSDESDTDNCVGSGSVAALLGVKPSFPPAEITIQVKVKFGNPVTFFQAGSNHLFVIQLRR